MLFLGINYTQFYFSMDKEFGVIELLGAFCLLVTSFILLKAAWDYKKLHNTIKDYRFIMLLLAGCLFFWASGEEISWGQHFFKTHTPEWLAEINDQKETNLHNINKKFFDRTLERLIAILTMLTVVQHFRKKEMFVGFRLPTYFLNLALFTIMIYRNIDSLYLEVWTVSYLFLILYPIRAFLDRDQKALAINIFTIVLMVAWVVLLRMHVDILSRSHNFYHEIRETAFSILTIFFAYQMLQDVRNKYISPRA